MYSICRAGISHSSEKLGALTKPGTHYKYQCNQDERRKVAELRRRKIIQKIKCEYRINLDEFNENLANKIIAEVETFEKQKRATAKSKAERRLNFMKKLIQEENYKRRGAKNLPVIRKIKKKETGSLLPAIIRNAEVEYQEEEEHEEETIKEEEVVQEESLNEVRIPEEEEFTQEEEVGIEGEISEKSLTTVQKSVRESEPEPDLYGPKALNSLLAKKIKPLESLKQSEIIKETHLECNPPTITFENCEPNRAYKQTYRITNVSLDIIHCRFVGIEVMGMDKDQPLPFRVEVLDNAYLRPGLSFTSKVHLNTTDTLVEMHGHIEFETRKKKNPNQYLVFLVPLMSLPARCVIHVSPSELRFPSVPWSVATGTERPDNLKKTIRIRNSGGKECTCKITKISKDEKIIPEGDESVTDEEYTSEYRPEFDKIIEELIDNVFEVFRFSQQYHIHVPARSSVKIDVDFIPEYKGYHHDVALIRFEGSNFYSEERVEMVGDIKKIPLRIDPTTIDLKICTINTGLYEGTFRIYNDSNSSFPVRLKVPGSMKNHSLVFPKSPVVQPWSYRICSVRLFPSLSIIDDAYRYYNNDTKVLEFPVFIEPRSPSYSKEEKMKLFVFAILTDYTLQLRPSEINFGSVNTLETVRTEISLTNHSLTELEYGFLNLPLGVRIEPNNGFGVILPKETIPLYLLYSPVLKANEKEGYYTFEVQVTSISELGGYGKKPEPTETEITEDQSTVNGELIYNTEVTETPKDSISIDDTSTEEEDEEESTIDPEEEARILQEKERRIRNYLRQKDENSVKDESVTTEKESQQEREGETDFKVPYVPKEINVILCNAILVKPLCELSATVLRLPPTPLASFSVMRFLLHGTNPQCGDKCNCGFPLETGKYPNDSLFEARFEFVTSNPMVSVVPRIGHITQGESVPLKIVFRPEFSNEELSYQSRILKAELLYEEEIKSRDGALQQKSKMRMKTIRAKPKKVDVESKDVNLATLDINSYDLFAGQKALEQMIDPFHITVKATCTVKTLPCSSMPERTERHNMIIIAQVVKPAFIYLGNCQEIKFGKVAIGDRARKMIEIQNISLKRIAPRVSALNPHGPFTCTTGFKMDKVDPEHIWRHPITFEPTKEQGKEEEFFEISSGTTIIRLKVNGEGIMPRCAFFPNFELCIMEIAKNSVTEVDFKIENLSEVEVRLKFIPENLMVSVRPQTEMSSIEVRESKKSILSVKRSSAKVSQATKRSYVFLDEIPRDIINQLNEEFGIIENPPENVFSIDGLNSKGAVIIPPMGKALFKIKCRPPEDKEYPSSKESLSEVNSYAVRYQVILGKSNLLKQFVLVGTMDTYK